MTNLTKTPCGMPSLRRMAVRLLCIVSILILASCKKYYTVPEDGLEVHKTFTDDSEVLFTLSAGELVYTNVEIGDWSSVYRKSNKEQNGWIRTDQLVRVDDTTEDSLSAEATAERKAKRQAERDKVKQREDSIMAKMANAVYYTVVADSIDLYTDNMSTKEGRKHGRKFSVLEKGRRIYSLKEGQSWIYVYTADEGEGKHGYIEARGLERLDEATTDSLNNIRKDHFVGYAFKYFFPPMVIICIVLSLLAIWPYVLMLRQQKKRGLNGILLTYLCAIVITFIAAARLDGSLNFKWIYNLLPMALFTLLTYPLLYTDLGRTATRIIMGIVMVLMLPLSIMLFTHRQEGSFGLTLLLWALNAFLYFAFVWIGTFDKCPHCGMYGKHQDAGITYEGREHYTSEHREEHQSKVVNTETRYGIDGSKTVINYVSPAYVIKTITRGLVDVYARHSRCIRCHRKFLTGYFFKQVGETSVKKTIETK